jgi:hypothetical protein
MRALRVCALLAVLLLPIASVHAQRASDGGAPADASVSVPPLPPLPPGAREVEVVVNNGYAPAVIDAVEGERLRLRLVRRDYSPCSREVVFPSFGIRRMLPTNQPVVIDLPPLPAGEHPFQCWMNMLRGRIVARPRAGQGTTVAADAGAPRDAARPPRRGR